MDNILYRCSMGFLGCVWPYFEHTTGVGQVFNGYILFDS